MKKLFTFILFGGFSQAQTVISGQVINMANGEPIPYAAVGIKGKAMGTLSNEGGYFNLLLKDVGINDSLKVSSIGFIARSFSLQRAQQFENEPIYLTPEAIKLNEVVIKPSKTYTIVLGNKKYNKNIHCSFQGSENNFLGVEAAIKANNKKEREVWLDEFNFYVSKNLVEDTIVFRLNFYEKDKQEMPGKNILKKPIIFKIYKQTGIITVDLKPYMAYTKDDFFISIECLSKKVNKDNLTFSGSIIGPAYFKMASFSNWEKINLMGLDFNVKASYTKP